MSLAELFIIALGLSMDAFAVAIGLGLSACKISFKNLITVGLYFGFFQAAMPLLGYIAGSQFADSIVAFDHWIAFILLSIIGGKMVKESFAKDKREIKDVSFTPNEMLPLAVATSIDALAAGISFAFLNVDIAPAVSFIGIITLVFSSIGVKIGCAFGSKFKAKAEFAGGAMLIFMGMKILLEHTGILII